VLVVVYTADGSTLLLQRHDPAGYWQSVTGGLRASETPRAAAERELREETGLVGVTLVDLETKVRYPIAAAWRARYAPQVSHNVEHQFAVRLARQQVVTLDSAEHAACAWVPIERAIRLVSSSSNRAALEQIARGVRR
jgi:dATP pyrophosphohydrolase